MSIVAWVLLGLIAGFVGSKLVNKTGEGVLLDIVLGIVGAIVGGYVFSMFGAHGVTGLKHLQFNRSHDWLGPGVGDLPRGQRKRETDLAKATVPLSCPQRPGRVG
jgi:uncharacterized membrane protein YeaQ/YmgE (transglycosylase-associated protein family)